MKELSLGGEFGGVGPRGGNMDVRYRAFFAVTLIIPMLSVYPAMREKLAHSWTW